jgi:hypothetical protein
MVRCIDQHEVSGGSADFRTGHHQTEMGRLDVITAPFEAMHHGRADASLITALALFDAGLHFPGKLVHDSSFLSEGTRSLSFS